MNTDDPKITAYALDELDPATRAEIESALRTDPALAAEIAELRNFTAGLRKELHAERAEALTTEQRASLLSGASEGTAPSVPGISQPSPAVLVERPRAWWRSTSFASAAAACVIVGAGIWFLGSAHSPYHETESPDRSGFKIAMDEAQNPGDFAPQPAEEPLRPFVAAAPPPAAVTASTAQLDTLPISDLESDESKRALNAPQAPPPPVASLKPAEAAASSLSIASFENMQSSTRALSASDGRKVIGGTLRARVTSDYALASPSAGSTVYKESESRRAQAAAEVGDPSSLTSARTPRTERLNQVNAELNSIQDGLDLLKTAMSPVDPVEAGRKVAEELGKLSRVSSTSKEQQSRLKQLSEAAAFLKTMSEDSAASQKQLQGLQDRMERLAVEREALTQTEPANTEAYDTITDNPFLASKENPLSTFSIDVDTASYTNIRRMLNGNSKPPKGAVRIEELVNYFRYDYPQPNGDHPFGAVLEAATCPWQPVHRLVRIGIKAREIEKKQRPVSNLVFLVDVSGSMEPENKLPLVKQCLRLLTDQLEENDSVSIAVYAGASGCVLEPTQDKDAVRAALDRLSSGGSTNGGAGIQLAYNLAQRAFKKGASNRVILCTDGDFNVGVSDQSQLVSMIQGKAKTGVFLSVFGFGMGNLKDSTLEKLADKGNGTYGYIDSLAEGRRVFVDQLTGTLHTVAKDVKIQVEFNPTQVSGYRLIGYENRMLAKEDFNDDTKDAGEIGAGHTVTALYEVVPVGKEIPTAVDALKYTEKPQAPEADKPQAAASNELLTVKMRYKQPEGDVSTKLELPLVDAGLTWEKSSRDFRWAAAVAGFGMMLRESPYKGSLSWSLVDELAAEGRAETVDKDRVEFTGLIDKARALSGDERVSANTKSEVAEPGKEAVNDPAESEATFERVTRLASRRVKNSGADQDTVQKSSITAVEGSFDQKTRLASFAGEVSVRSLEFDAVCDRLVASLKEKNVEGGDQIASAMLIMQTKSPAELKGGAILNATADAESGKMVGISRDRREADGTMSKIVGVARKATYDAKTGDVVLTGWPSVQQGFSRCVATSEETVMTLRSNGALSVVGPHRTIIRDIQSGKR